MVTLNRQTFGNCFKKPSQRQQALYFYVLGVLMAFAAAAVLIASDAAK